LATAGFTQNDVKCCVMLSEKQNFAYLLVMVYRVVLKVSGSDLHRHLRRRAGYQDVRSEEVFLQGWVELVRLVVLALPSLAYCAIFSVMSSADVDWHICVCMRASSYQPVTVPVYA